MNMFSFHVVIINKQKFIKALLHKVTICCLVSYSQAFKYIPIQKKIISFPSKSIDIINYIVSWLVFNNSSIIFNAYNKDEKREQV